MALTFVFGLDLVQHVIESTICSIHVQPDVFPLCDVQQDDLLGLCRRNQSTQMSQTLRTESSLSVTKTNML